MDTKDKAFVVTGCHRSATSLVAKALDLLGVDMGEDLIGPGPGNMQGHYEDREVVRLNELMLKQAGGSWRHPPTPPIDEVEGMHKVTNGRQGLWGFKDPRLCITLDDWLPYLGDDPHVVAVFRRPMKIAQSLKKRNGFDLGEGLFIARLYQRRLIESLMRFSEAG